MGMPPAGGIRRLFARTTRAARHTSRWRAGSCRRRYDFRVRPRLSFASTPLGHFGPARTVAVVGVGYGPRVPSLQERVEERRRAVAIARHLRESEGLPIAQIAARLGRSEATVKGYFYDPTGEKARAVKARYQGSCRQCGAPTQARGGKGDAYAYCKNCHPGAIQARWTRELVLEAMRAWRDRLRAGAELV